MRSITYGAAVEGLIAGEVSVRELAESALDWDELESRSLTNLLLLRIAGSLAEIADSVNPQLKLEA